MGIISLWTRSRLRNVNLGGVILIMGMHRCSINTKMYNRFQLSTGLQNSGRVKPRQCYFMGAVYFSSV